MCTLVTKLLRLSFSFRFLFLEKPKKFDLEDNPEKYESFMADFGEQSEVGKALAALQEVRQETMIQYAWIFTHGLAKLVNSGALGSCSDQLILCYLIDAGEAFNTLGIGKEDWEKS